MTQFALILAIQVGALAYAMVLGRSLLMQSSGSARLRRLAGALERATAAFQSRQLRAGLIGVSAAALGLVALGLTTHVEGSLGRVFSTLGSVLALSLGAGLCFLATFAGVRIALRSGIRIPSAAAGGLDRVLGVCIRTGAVTSLLSEALATLGLWFVFGAAFALAGGPALDATHSLALCRDLLKLLAGFPLGGAIALLILQRSASTYHAASAVGGDVTAHKRFGLSAGDPRNPAIVSDLSGLYLGESACVSALGFVISATSQVALLSLGLIAESLSPGDTSALVLLPFVVRAFFVLASGFGLSVVRTEEMTSPGAGILRGYASTLVIGIFGLSGSVFWMARDHFAFFFFSGLLGAAASLLVGLTVFASLRLGRKEAPEALRLGSDPVAFAGLGSALHIALLPLLVLGLTAFVSSELAARSGLEGFGLTVSLLTWATLLGSAPFALAASSVSAAAEGARSIAALGAVDLDVQRRATRLDETRTVAESGRAQLSLAAAITALLSALSVPPLAQGSLRWDVGLLRPGVMLAAGLGAVLTLSYAGSAAQAGARGAREIASEIERQLRAFSRDTGVAAVPHDFSPSYKLCIELSARWAFFGLAPAVLGVLTLPVLLTLLIHGFHSAVHGASAAEGLVSSVLCTGLVGFFAAFALDLGRATCEKAVRGGRAAVGIETDFASVQTSIGTLLGRPAGPAARGVVVATAAVALALAPFLK